MSESGPGPSSRRRYLGKVLRKLREAAGMTAVEAAKAIRVSQPTISGIEGGKRAILPRHVYKLLEVYGVDQARADALIAMSEQANERSWWESYGDIVHQWFEVYVGLESEAEEIWAYEAEFVYGLFQTPEYVRAIGRAAWPQQTEEWLNRSVELRLERQQRLDSQHLKVVLNESVLYREVGGREVMREQLRHILNLTQRPTIDIRILPFSAGAHPAMTGSFVMLRFPDTAEMDLIYTENERGATYFERAADLARYGDVFTRLHAISLSAAESRDLLSRVIDTGNPGKEGRYGDDR